MANGNVEKKDEVKIDSHGVFKITPSVKKGFDYTVEVENVTEIDMYIKAGFIVDSIKEKNVDVALSKAHDKRIINDKNGLAIIMGPFSEIPRYLKGFTFENLLAANDDIAKLMENRLNLSKEYEKFSALQEGEEKEDYYVKSSEQFKQYASLAISNSLDLLNVKLNAEGKVNMNSRDFAGNVKRIKTLLYEIHVQKEQVKDIGRLHKGILPKTGFIVPSNLEYGKRNIGYSDAMETFAKEENVSFLYNNQKNQNIIKAQFVFKNSYLLNNVPHVLNAAFVAIDTLTLSAAEAQVKNIMRYEKGLDLIVISGCEEEMVQPYSRWFYDEKADLYVNSVMHVIYAPSYMETPRINPVQGKSRMVNVKPENKYKIGLYPNIAYVQNPTLINKDMSINIHYTPERIAKLKEVELTKEKLAEIIEQKKFVEITRASMVNENVKKKDKGTVALRYLQSTSKVVDEPVRPSVHSVPITSESELLRKAHLVNAPESKVVERKLNTVENLL